MPIVSFPLCSPTSALLALRDCAMRFWFADGELVREGPEACERERGVRGGVLCKRGESFVSLSFVEKDDVRAAWIAAEGRGAGVEEVEGEMM